MKQIFRTTFGSHLYGTSTPASDFDFKSVFIPDARGFWLPRSDPHCPSMPIRRWIDDFVVEIYRKQVISHDI